MPTLIKEASPGRAAVSEKLVAEIWKRQMLASPLRTTTGQKLDVVYCGRHCCDHGPDFRGALIAFDGELRHGDVEVHLRAADWRGHGHHLDEAYRGVILHVVMWPPGDPPPRKLGGETSPVICLEHHLAVPLGEIDSLFAAQPYLPFRCTAKLGNDQVLRLLDEAGEQRLRQRAASLEGELAVRDSEEALYRALMEALGYSRNTAAFAQLADIAPLSLLRSIALGEKPGLRPLLFRAVLLAKAGLLTPGSEAAAAWQQLSSWDDGCRVTIPWRRGRVRPCNHPDRRLAGAAELLAATIDQGLAAAFLETIRTVEPALVHRRLRSALMVKAADGVYLIGRARAAEMAVNAVLPFALAFAESSGDRNLAQRALAVLAEYHAFPENEFSRYMAGMLLDGQGLPAARTARRQQGLLHIYKKWCADKRCADCPLGISPRF